jgi:hypothetical protein
VSLRAIFILMVVFVALGSFAIFDPLRRAEKREDAKDREEHVVWLKDKKLEGIQIKGQGPVTELLCALPEGCPFDGSADWNITQPAVGFVGKADSSSAATMASSILNLRHSEKLDFDAKDPDPREFGLDQPRAELTFRLKGEADPLVLKFGSNSPVGANVYLSVSREPRKIFLVPSYVPDMVNKDSFHWRSKRIFPGVDGTTFNRLGWKTKKMEVRAFKLGDKWRLDRPVSGPAGQIMLEGLASAVAYANAKSVFSPSRATTEAKSLLSAKPELEILFSTSKGEAHELKLFLKPGQKPGQGKGGKDFVAAVDQAPALLALDGTAFDRFFKDLLEYRQRSVLTDKDRSQVTEVRLTFPREKQETYLKREGTEWKYSAGAKPLEAISSARVNAFLDSLRDSSFRAIYPAKGNSFEAKAYQTQTADLYLELKAAGKDLLSAKFVVHNRGVALTEAEGEVRALGVDFLKVIPVRLSDLNESSNKQVVVTEEKKGATDGDHPEPESGDHSGHHH